MYLITFSACWFTWIIFEPLSDTWLHEYFQTVKESLSKHVVCNPLFILNLKINMSRGRGRGTGLSFNAELLGVGRGQEAIPASLLTPPPLYPPRLAPPCPLVEGPETDYLLAVRKEFLHQMKHSGFQLGGGSSSTTGATTALKVDRYSDRYQTRQDVPLQLDWSRFPSELRPENRKRRVKRRPVVNLAQVKNPNLVC